LFNLTDAVVFVFVLYFLNSGWRKGIARSLAGPASLICAAVIGYLYFKRTQNAAVSILIVLLGPLLLRWLVSVILILLTKASERRYPSDASRLLGMLVNVSWNGTFLVLFIWALSFLPAGFPKVTEIQENVKSSFVYPVITGLARSLSFEKASGLKIRPAANGEPLTLDIGKPDTESLARLQETEEFKELMKDPRVQDVLEDEKIRQQLQDKNIPALLSNPRILKLLYDPDLVQKFMTIYQNIQSGEDIPEAAHPQKSGGEDPE